MGTQKGNVAIVAVVAFAIVLTAGVIGWLLLKKTAVPTVSVAAQPAASPVLVTTPALPTTGTPSIPLVTSMTTSLDGKDCQTVSDESLGEVTIQNCPGVAGYVIEVDYGDARESITVIAPDKKKYPLSFDQTVGYGFSNLGKNVEWRVKTGSDGKSEPVALLIPFRMTDPNNMEMTSDGSYAYKDYTVVAKIAGSGTCVTEALDLSVPANKNQMTQWQEADSAATKACVKVGS